MEISKKDRIILINQYRILSKLEPESADHYEELIHILEHGYEIFYPKIDELVSEDIPTAEGVLVLEILDLYRMIEDHKSQHPGDEVSKHPWGTFSGFDGNNEGDYLGFTRFLIEKQSKYQEQQKYSKAKDGFNSHMPVVDKYKKMLKKWESKKRSMQLSKSDVLEILDA
jgi:uncharacterized protein YfbU (UPF0304 family)